MIERLRVLHQEIQACRACPRMMGTPVHGPAIRSQVFLLGQAPGPHEAGLGRPFAYTAGKTLFRWFEEASGVDEQTFRAHVYMAAVARCFPGKAGRGGGGDRVPDAEEIARCSRHLLGELDLLRPRLILAVGKLAISQVLGSERFGRTALLNDVVGKEFQVEFHGHSADAIAPSKRPFFMAKNGARKDVASASFEENLRTPGLDRGDGLTCQK